MLNVLKNSILIVLFVLVSSSGILAKGQNLSFNGSCLECNFCRNEICEVSTVPLLLFLHERPTTTYLPCEKSLFSRRSTKLQVGPIALQVAVTSSQLAVFFPCN